MAEAHRQDTETSHLGLTAALVRHQPPSAAAADDDDDVDTAIKHVLIANSLWAETARTLDQQKFQTSVTALVQQKP
jgi:hypothetical protein